MSGAQVGDSSKLTTARETPVYTTCTGNTRVLDLWGFLRMPSLLIVGPDHAVPSRSGPLQR